MFFASNGVEWCTSIVYHSIIIGLFFIISFVISKHDSLSRLHHIILWQSDDKVCFILVSTAISAFGDPVSVWLFLALPKPQIRCRAVSVSYTRFCLLVLSSSPTSSSACSHIFPVCTSIQTLILLRLFSHFPRLYFHTNSLPSPHDNTFFVPEYNDFSSFLLCSDAKMIAHGLQSLIISPPLPPDQHNSVPASLSL